MNWADGGTGRVTVGGLSLEVATWGPPPGEAPTFVLLHEGLGCVALWRDFPARLAEATGFGVVAYSRAGYGRSDPKPLPWPLDYMTREAMDVLPGMLDAVGFERGVLLGHSDGATIAAVYSGSVFDARVRGLVLMAPHFFTEPVGLAAIAEAKTAYETGDLAGALAKYHDAPEVAFRGWNESWLHPDFRDWDVGEVIDYFRVPTLAVQGAADQYGTMAQIDEIESRSYAPVDVAVIGACGHSPHLEKQDETLGAIAEFAARLERMEREEVRVA